MLSARRARQTIQWPYQNLSPLASREDATLPSLPGPARRKTWQPRGAIDNDDDDDDDDTISPVDIPDYVINFLRGETPETMARRRREKRRRSGARALDANGLVAVVAGDRYVSDKTSPASPPADAHDEQHLLSRSGEKQRRGCLQRLGQGWRRGIVLGAGLSMLALVVSLTLFIALVVRPGPAASSHGMFPVFSGSSAASLRIDWGLRALSSTFAIGLLAAANYAFQILSSPTRSEVQMAHGRRRWLGIGVPSIRNLLYISNQRVVLSSAMLLAGLSAQLM
jgi:hypothetical protein